MLQKLHIHFVIDPSGESWLINVKEACRAPVNLFASSLLLHFFLNVMLVMPPSVTSQTKCDMLENFVIRFLNFTGVDIIVSIGILKKKCVKPNVFFLPGTRNTFWVG